MSNSLDSIESACEELKTLLEGYDSHVDDYVQAIEHRFSKLREIVDFLNTTNEWVGRPIADWEQTWRLVSEVLDCPMQLHGQGLKPSEVSLFGMFSDSSSKKTDPKDLQLILDFQEFIRPSNPDVG